MGKDMKKTKYAIKQVGDRYYPVIVDREAGGHHQARNPRQAAFSAIATPRPRPT